MESNVFDVEHLQKLSFERSKIWADFMDGIADREASAEIDIESIEDFYENEDDENNHELASMEDDDTDDLAVDTEVLRNLTNTTRISMLLNKNKNVVLTDSVNGGENDKFLDLLNQTMPIINEHNRQLKETGFDRILSTFDKQKIEDKVGSWLNRHNTLYGGDYTICAVPKKDRKKDFKTMSALRMERVERSCRKRSPIGRKLSNDSDDSLQSGETARYIRSSKAGAIKNSASSTTMIKTYRMVKSTREALREKYACEKADDDYHLRTIRHRRRFPNELEYHHNHYDLARTQRSNKYEMQTKSSSSAYKARRKVLRKRNHSNSCSNMDSSSESDYYDEDQRFRRQNLKPCCNKHYCNKKVRPERSAFRMPTARMNRMYYYSHSLTKSLTNSSSSSSFSSTCDRRGLIKRNYKYCKDNKPCKRESECHCCNERKLCEKYNHIADTSTEEWYVENSYSPKHLLNTPTSLTVSSKFKTFASDKLSTPIEVSDEIEDSKPKRNIKTEKTKQKGADKKESLKQKPKDTKNKTNSKFKEHIEHDSFDEELQMAIQASKELYEEEQKKKMNTDIKEKKKQSERLPTKPLRKKSKAINKEHEKPDNSKKPTRKRQTSKEEELSVKHKMEEKSPKLQKTDDDFIKPQSPTINISTKNVDSTTTNTTEATFFAPSQSQAIYNSTAMCVEGGAYNRQIKGREVKMDFDKTSGIIAKKMKNKEPTKKVTASTTVTSTTIRSYEMNSTVKTAQLKDKTTETPSLGSCDDLSDCTLVTSTTNIETPATAASEDTTLMANQRLTQKGIVIYAPEIRSRAPAHSFTSDGHFTITKEHLSSVLGEKPAEKFLKYYIGRKRFNCNSTVYFRPPSMTSSYDNNASTSSDSDDDLDSLGQYGDLYESLNN